jgi:hypothetical protein
MPQIQYIQIYKWIVYPRMIPADKEEASSRRSLEIVINIEEKWHINLLSNVAPQLQHLTLTIRTNSKAKEDHHQKPTDSDSHCPSASNHDLDPLIKVIENMTKLTKLRINSEVCGTFRIRSTSLEHLLFQGALVLEECSCPRLRTMDISFALDGMKDDDHIIFKELPRSVEELTLRIDDYDSTRTGAQDGDGDGDGDAGDNGKSFYRVNDYEDELQRLLLQKMVRLKRLQLVPSERCRFLVTPSSPKSICER